MPASLSAAAPGPPRRWQLDVVPVALAVASFGHGLTMPLLSLVLSHQGAGETLIGLDTAIYFIAVIAVAPLASRLVRTRSPARDSHRPSGGRPDAMCSMPGHSPVPPSQRPHFAPR